MAKGAEINIIELLEYLQDKVENSEKVPISGKAMIDKKEVLEVIEQIINYLPDELKKARWLLNERDKILSDAKKEYESIKQKTVETMRANVENHDVVKEAKMRAQEILNNAKREAKAIRVGSREYSNDVLSQLDEQIESKKAELIKSLQASFELVASDVNENFNTVSSTIKENIKELQVMKKWFFY